MDEKDFEPESVDEVRNAIAMLPEGYRLIVNLVLVEGYSHEEAAQMLNISPSTSRSQLSRAKQKLSNILTLTVNA